MKTNDLDVHKAAVRIDTAEKCKEVCAVFKQANQPIFKSSEIGLKNGISGGWRYVIFNDNEWIRSNNDESYPEIHIKQLKELLGLKVYSIKDLSEGRVALEVSQSDKIEDLQRVVFKAFPNDEEGRSILYDEYLRTTLAENPLISKSKFSIGWWIVGRDTELPKQTLDVFLKELSVSKDLVFKVGDLTNKGLIVAIKADVAKHLVFNKEMIGHSGGGFKFIESIFDEHTHGGHCLWYGTENLKRLSDVELQFFDAEPIQDKGQDEPMMWDGLPVTDDNGLKYIKRDGVRVFETGSVRSNNDGRERYDLIPQLALDVAANIFGKNIGQFGSGNHIQYCIPEKACVESLKRHLASYTRALEGYEDVHEDDAGSILTNALMLVHTIEMKKLGLYKVKYGKGI